MNFFCNGKEQNYIGIQVALLIAKNNKQTKNPSKNQHRKLSHYWYDGEQSRISCLQNSSIERHYQNLYFFFSGSECGRVLLWENASRLLLSSMWELLWFLSFNPASACIRAKPLISLSVWFTLVTHTVGENSFFSCSSSSGVSLTLQPGECGGAGLRWQRVDRRGFIRRRRLADSSRSQCYCLTKLWPLGGGG